jgi:hypothetical protein
MLLDAEAQGADWREAVAIIFGLDPVKEPVRAKLVHDSHRCASFKIVVAHFLVFVAHPSSD